MTAARRLPVPSVLCAVRDGVAWLTLDRARSGNTLDATVLGDLAAACAAVDDRDDVRVVVLAANGRVFSRGLPRGVAWPAPRWPDAVDAVARVRKPVIACLQGEAVGLGASLALACDLRVGTPRASLALPEVPAGRLPGGGATQRLARLVGPARALDVVLLGRRVDAREMLAWGLLHEVVPAAKLAGTAARLAGELARRGPLAVRLAKEAVLRALDLPLDDGIRLEHDLYVLLQTTADRREGVAAFRERRPARFTGR